jgi:hypothetical protein
MRQHKFQLPILSDSEQHTSGIALDRHSMASSPPEAPENRDIVDIVDGLPTPLSHHTPAHSNLPVSEQRKQNTIKQNKTNMYTYIYIYFMATHGFKISSKCVTISITGLLVKVPTCFFAKHNVLFKNTFGSTRKHVAFADHIWIKGLQRLENLRARKAG